MDEITRRLTERIRRALATYRIVVVTGPRQSGKTTLIHQVLGGAGTFRSLDDDHEIATALTDPIGFASYGEPPRAFDEIHLGGDALVRAIKREVDRDRSRGQFLLSGSADFLSVPNLSESLAGRAVFFELWPFSQGELHDAPDGLLQAAFDSPDQLSNADRSRITADEYAEIVCTGGFPEAVEMLGEDRGDWYDSYVATVTQRDIADLAGARRAEELPKLLRLLAARTAGEVVISQIHADSDLGRDTTRDYLSFLRMTYLVHRLPAWSTNHTARAKKHPKVYLCDTGLAAHLLGVDADGLRRPGDARRGPLGETFVANELVKQVRWSRLRATLYHFRDREGAEVDIVAEAPDGRIVGIEVKSALTVAKRDLVQLQRLRDKLGERFVCGIIVYWGDTPLSFGDRLMALPLSYLWEIG